MGKKNVDHKWFEFLQLSKMVASAFYSFTCIKIIQGKSIPQYTKK